MADQDFARARLPSNTYMYAISAMDSRDTPLCFPSDLSRPCNDFSHKIRARSTLFRRMYKQGQQVLSVVNTLNLLAKGH